MYEAGGASRAMSAAILTSEKVRASRPVLACSLSRNARTSSRTPWSPTARAVSMSTVAASTSALTGDVMIKLLRSSSAERVARCGHYPDQLWRGPAGGASPAEDDPGAVSSAARQAEDAVSGHDGPAHDEDRDEYLVPVRAQPAVERRQVAGRRTGRENVHQQGQPHQGRVDHDDDDDGHRDEFDVGIGSGDHLNRGDERDTRREQEQANGKGAAGGGIGDHPRDEPLLGFAGIGLLRLPPGEEGTRREHQQAEAEPQAVAGGALAVVVQAGVAQNRDHHQAHYQAHDDRARQVGRADQPRPGGAEVD